MKFNDRLEYIDQCVAGDKSKFNELLSAKMFNTFDRGFNLLRDHVLKKSEIKDIECSVESDSVTLHIETDSTIDDMIADSMPKKGISATKTDIGIDLNIKVMNTTL